MSTIRLKDIKQKYPELFAAINQAALQEISEKLLINDSFVAYIALHFLVSYERRLAKCSSGLRLFNGVRRDKFN